VVPRSREHLGSAVSISNHHLRQVGGNLPLHHRRVGALRGRVGNEVVTVGFGSLDRYEQPARHHLTRIDSDASQHRIDIGRADQEPVVSQQVHHRLELHRVPSA
jgi:hypothetical protein